MLFCTTQVLPWSENSETAKLRRQFEVLKDRLRQITSDPDRLVSTQVREAAHPFIMGRKDPKVDCFREGMAQREFREGIEEMRDLVEFIR